MGDRHSNVIHNIVDGIVRIMCTGAIIHWTNMIVNGTFSYERGWTAVPVCISILFIFLLSLRPADKKNA